MSNCSPQQLPYQFPYNVVSFCIENNEIAEIDEQLQLPVFFRFKDLKRCFNVTLSYLAVN